ncbi:MAG: hypothetical protein QOI54_2983 [Actinomycetota bacterium]|nr:hypothetical protein [Actinomycetota bacterium]
MLAALRSAGLGLLAVMVLVLVAWASAADSGASATQAVGAGLAIWLAGHLTRLVVPGGQFGLAPLGLTVLPALLLYTSASRAARAAQVRSWRGVGSLTAVLAATYAVVAVLVSLLARSPAVSPQPVSAFLGAGLVAAAAGGAGAVHGCGRAGAWWVRLPFVLRAACTGAAGALAVLGAAGGLLVGVLLLLHRGAAEVLFHGIDRGGSGALLLGLICLLYVPTAVVWGAAYLLGPGFAVGVGTSVSVTGVHLGAVPAMPLLAALPSGQVSGGVAWPLLAVTVAGCGLVAGVLVERSARLGGVAAAPARSWRELGILAAATGAVTGLALALLGVLASGPAGPGRMAHVGPTWWVLGPAAAAEVALAVFAVLAARRLQAARSGSGAGD